jgi:hypothetical protein
VDIPRPGHEALFGVLELRGSHQLVLGRAGQDDLAHLLLELGYRHGDVTLADAEEPAHADDRVRKGTARRHDQVIDFTDLVAGFVVDVLAEDLLLRAPASTWRISALETVAMDPAVWAAESAAPAAMTMLVSAMSTRIFTVFLPPLLRPFPGQDYYARY